MAGDLHTHSTCSDGSVPIHRLPLMAARLGLSALALSDHDTTLSAQYAYDHPVRNVPPYPSPHGQGKLHQSKLHQKQRCNKPKGITYLFYINGRRIG